MSSLLYNRFKMLKKCGEGGTGEVFQAQDTRLKRVVALKRVRAGTEPERRQKALRLLKEAEHLAQLDHPNVVMVYDCIETETSVTIVLEFIKGTPFRDLYQKRPIPEPEFLAVFRQLLSALEAVHAAGIIHRDVNPKNVLVTEAGIVKLTDFGLAASAEAGEHRAGGTIGYMAPEALKKGAKIGFGVDIYGLGFLSYQALLGGPEFQKLYGATTPVDWARWLLSREKFRTLVELSKPVSLAFSGIIERMLEKDPKDRYQRITDVTRDFERYLQTAGRFRGSGRLEDGPGSAGVRRLLPSLGAQEEDG